ncbi:glycosyltransferase [Aliiroseovarius sp.]|uniref:glycosyltransferase n=1 Tax=Aliiroseovarius sp. TaxID=1872442 RepID=UPI002619C0A8|nr:glycosyltransferase [Aliiroseovarius sp.]
MASLRILMLTTFYPPYSFGGDGVSVERMARALVARGHRVTVVHDENAYLTLGGELRGDAPEVPRNGIEVIGLRSRFGPVSNLLVQQTGRAVLHANRLRQIVADTRPDIIWHNNVSLMGAPGILGIEAPLRVYEAHEHWLVCPTHVLWRHNQKPCESRQCLRCVLAHRRPPQLWRATGMLNKSLDKMDLIIAKSRFSRDKHRAYGLKQDMEVLPLFLPPLAAPSATESNETRSGAPPVHPRPYFLFVGRLEMIKGVQDLLPAIQRHGQADLLIAGDGEFAQTLKEKAAGNPHVHFLGRLPPEKLTAYYKSAIASLVPSLCYETFGAILIESFRMGTPVIARRLGPFPEIVGAAGGGLLFETQEELVAAMAQLQNDKATRARLAAGAQSGFDALWREDRVLAAYGAAFAGAARRKGNPALAQSIEGSFIAS